MWNLINVSLFSTLREECQGQTTQVYGQPVCQKHFSVYTHSNVLPRWVHFASLVQTYRPGLTLCQTPSILGTFLKEANYKYFFPGLGTPLFLQSDHYTSHILQIFSNQMGFFFCLCCICHRRQVVHMWAGPFCKSWDLRKMNVPVHLTGSCKIHRGFWKLVVSSFTRFIMHHFSAGDKSPANRKVLSLTSFMEICCGITC